MSFSHAAICVATAALSPVSPVATVSAVVPSTVSRLALERVGKRETGEAAGGIGDPSAFVVAAAGPAPMTAAQSGSMEFRMTGSWLYSLSASTGFDGNLYIYSFRYMPADLSEALETAGEAAARRIHEYLDEVNQGMVDHVLENGLAFLHDHPPSWSPDAPHVDL